jgi:hypothetical protein
MFARVHEHATARRLFMSWFKKLDAQAQVAFMAAVVGACSGLLGGIAGPVIQSRFQQSTDSAKVRLEADLSRQTKFIEAQDAFLTSATNALWAWRYLCMRVAYEGSNKDEAFQKEWNNYNANIWASLNAVRSHISQFRRLGSEEAFQKVLPFYEEAVALDQQISGAAKLGPEARSKAFQTLNGKIYEVTTKRVDDLLLLMATDMGISERNAELGRRR